MLAPGQLKVAASGVADRCPVETLGERTKADRFHRRPPRSKMRMVRLCRGAFAAMRATKSKCPAAPGRGLKAFAIRAHERAFMKVRRQLTTSSEGTVLRFLIGKHVRLAHSCRPVEPRGRIERRSRPAAGLV